MPAFVLCTVDEQELGPSRQNGGERGAVVYSWSNCFSPIFELAALFRRKIRKAIKGAVSATPLFMFTSGDTVN